jgi:serine/threonine-protein kinase HipA
MAVHSKSAHYKLSEIQYRHWESLANRSGVDDAWEAMQNMALQMDAALVKVERNLSADFPMELANSVFQGVRQHLAQFKRQNK